ncbi:MAG TPA: hypothetical protein VFS40_12570 [Gemmatimonadales bacterium]|nr:hypothetical protein [Gemmatimonadales bacterium]
MERVKAQARNQGYQSLSSPEAPRGLLAVQVPDASQGLYRFEHDDDGVVKLAVVDTERGRLSIVYMVQ